MAKDTEDELIAALSSHLGKSKTDLVSEIEGHMTRLLRWDVGQAFEAAAAVQQIRGGHMNLDRAHKSMLVLLAHILERAVSRQDVAGGKPEDVK
ncbi:MAG: hypothetical protein M3416_04345 [Acidobacteriota bacterium]|nr:hypothetical protein [Acidobacteriota bacterium]